MWKSFRTSKIHSRTTGALTIHSPSPILLELFSVTIKREPILLIIQKSIPVSWKGTFNWLTYLLKQVFTWSIQRHLWHFRKYCNIFPEKGNLNINIAPPNVGPDLSSKLFALGTNSLANYSLYVLRISSSNILFCCHVFFKC